MLISAVTHPLIRLINSELPEVSFTYLKNVFYQRKHYASVENLYKLSCLLISSDFNFFGVVLKIKMVYSVSDLML